MAVVSLPQETLPFRALRRRAVFGNVRATFGRDRSRLGAAAAGAFCPARFINRGFIT